MSELWNEMKEKAKALWPIHRDIAVLEDPSTVIVIDENGNITKEGE